MTRDFTRRIRLRNTNQMRTFEDKRLEGKADRCEILYISACRILRLLVPYRLSPNTLSLTKYHRFVLRRLGVPRTYAYVCVSSTISPLHQCRAVRRVYCHARAGGLLQLSARLCGDSTSGPVPDADAVHRSGLLRDAHVLGRLPLATLGIQRR